MKIGDKTNTGLIIAPNAQTFMLKAQKRSDKKVKKLSVKTFQRNLKMLGLVRTYPNTVLANPYLMSVMYSNTPFIPPKWRNTSSDLKAIYYQRAVEKMGGKHALTFNLSPDLTLAAIESEGLKYIRHKLDGALTRYLGRKVEFWLVLESIIKDGRRSYRYIMGRPHIHGSLVIAESEFVKVKAALKSLNGNTSIEFRKNEIRFKPIEALKGGGDGWASYITKHNGHNDLFMPQSSTITKTHGVGSVAQELYNADRDALLSFWKVSNAS